MNTGMVISWIHCFETKRDCQFHAHVYTQGEKLAVSCLFGGFSLIDFVSARSIEVCLSKEAEQKW
jgi:hypothetical protein